MIKKVTFGIHQDVTFAEFGTGDISFSRGILEGDSHETLLVFHNADIAHKIGDTSNEWEGKSTDELQAPTLVMRFTKPESITALITSLAELQANVFEYQNLSNQ